MKKIQLFIGAILIASTTMFSQTPCVDGMAGIYPCENVDLMSTISLADLGGIQNMNDVWGWTEENSGREFAIVGLRNGTSFVEVTDPLNPEVLGFLPTATGNSLWRDIKVFQNHAFIVSEADGHGMQVFNLEELLADFELTPVTFEVSAYYDGFGSAHNIVINEESGFAYGVGTESFAGGLHFVDINDPLNPVIVGGFGEDDYTHDAHVLNYNGPDGDYFGREIAFCANEDAITIVDVTDKTDPIQISTLGYELSAYTHQGWLTDDGSFFIFNDEIDETSGFTATTKTIIMDVRDLDNPIIHFDYFGSSTAIDHNLYNNGSLCYQSNYRSGLRILDIGNVYENEISEIGYFDSQPEDDDQNYSGTWSNYAYFPSGTVIMSDMYSDFFILRPTLINAYRYAEVCANTDQVEFYIDVTSNTAITEAYSTDFLPNNMSVEIGEIEAPGRIPVIVIFEDVIDEGTYTIPVTLFDSGEQETVFTEFLKVVVTNGDLPVFSGFTPVDGFDSDEPSVTLSWDAIGELSTYTLIISDDADFSNILVEEDVVGTSYEYSELGTFYWKLVAPSTCRVGIESEVRTFTNNYLGIEDITSTIKFYPNPAQNELFIEGIKGEVLVYSADGKLVKKVVVNNSSSINVSELSSGVYVVKFSDSDAQISFIKE